MHPTLKTEGLNRFLADVSALKLRFPVAEIARATGEDRANVSRYIKGQIPASGAFVQRFYTSFRHELAKIGIHEIPKSYYIALAPSPPASPDLSPPPADTDLLAAIERRLAEIGETLKTLDRRQGTTERILLEYVARPR